MGLLTGTQYTVVPEERFNAIINGNFDIWQRGTSFAAASSGDYSADRFGYNKSGAMVHTLSQSTDVPTYAQSGVKSNYSLLVDCTTADTSITGTDHSMVRYTVEGYDYAQIAGGNATLSFWVKATKIGTYCVAFRNSGTNRSYVKEFTVSTTATWEKKTITVPLTETGGTWNYTNGAGLYITFALAAGPTYQGTADTWQTGNYLATSNQVNACDNVANDFRIAQVKLEPGIEATPWQPRSYAEEFAKCERYFCTIQRAGGSGYASGGSQNVKALTTIAFPTKMRLTPTMALNSLSVSTGNTSGTVPVLIIGSASSCVLSAVSAAAGDIRWYITGGYLSFDAEL